MHHNYISNIDATVCVPGDEPHTFKEVPAIVGEQYMEMISTWCRLEDPGEFKLFGEFGGEGDGTVYEIFNAIEELNQDGYFVD